MFPGLPGPAVTAVDVLVWRPDKSGADPKWLVHALNSPEVRARLELLAGGTTRQRVSGGNIKRFELPVPPLPEQRRIVARIESLFARTRRARADLERIAPLSTAYVQQRRRRAFDKEAAWPVSEPDGPLPNYQVPGRFEELSELPSGWRWAAMSTISEVAGGLTKNQRRSELPHEIPYLRVANIYADELRLAEIATIRVTAAEAKRVSLEAGDLLVVEGNGSVEQIGRVAVWDGSVPRCGHQNHLIRVRPGPRIAGRFLLHWLMSPQGRRILEAVASSSAGLHTLSLSKIAAVPVPVPSKRVSVHIAAVLDSGIGTAETATREATRALALLDRLERSILAKAFRGELVPQNPADQTETPPAPTTTPPPNPAKARRQAPASPGSRPSPKPTTPSPVGRGPG